MATVIRKNFLLTGRNLRQTLASWRMLICLDHVGLRESGQEETRDRNTERDRRGGGREGETEMHSNTEQHY